MSIKEWPDQGPVTAEELLLPVEEAIRRIHQIHYVPGSDPEYRGYDIGRRERASCLSPSQRTAAVVEKDEREQGRTPLLTWLLLTFQLGIEQGRRLREQEQPSLRAWKAMTEQLEKAKRIRRFGDEQ
jgi:hypothetical protein